MRYLLIALIFSFSTFSQQQVTNIKFGTSSVELRCYNKAASGNYFRNIEIRAKDTPVRLYFQKADKSVVDITGQTIFISYEADARGEESAGITVDQNKNFWGCKAVYFISITVPNRYVDINGEQREVAGNLNLDYLGLPFWISRNTAKS